ncbi:MAG: diguanylate cyclase [Thermosipho sp. (in: Bacteria)]|nr:diguanylate cyclase [Thermosipho sp. (in: thermotogales)]
MNNMVIDCIKNSINYIEENLLEEIYLEDIAKSAHMSVSLYSKLFKNLFGFTVKEYIIKRRMSLAAKDLIFTDDSILNIALKYGYSGYEQFSRAFKKIFYMSPTQYRKNGIYVNVFPKINLVLNYLDGGEFMKEMENGEVMKILKSLEGGYILDVDIDRFADINENFGRKAGDFVLIEVSKRIKEVLEKYSIESDVIRIAGDEFMVIIKEKDLNFVKNLTQEILKRMKDPIEFDGKILDISVSIGVSEFYTGLGEEKVIENARNAMLDAKREGRNRFKIN